MKNNSYDYLEPVEVTKGVYWVGLYDEKANFHCNPYLLIDDGEAVIFDPAGIRDFPRVASKIFSLVDPSQVSYIVLHHQDPDLCGCVPLLEEVISNKDLKIVTHSRTAHLIRYYGTKSEFYAVDRNGYSLLLKSGRTLRFMKTPFCHFPAAIVTYDAQSDLLFSSDLFAAISSEWSLFAGEGYERHMEAFHVEYMASSKHVSAVMEQIARLDLAMILPQHGSILKGDSITRSIEFLRGLRCGIDVFSNKEEMFGWTPDQV